MPFGLLALPLFGGGGVAIGTASGQGTASAVGVTKTIQAGIGNAPAKGAAAAIGQASGIIAAVGRADGIGSASASGGADWWGFGAEAFGAFPFAGPQLPDVGATVTASTGTAAGIGAAAAASASLGIISTIARAEGFGRAAGVANLFSSAGHAFGFGEARGVMVNATPPPFALWPSTLPQCPMLTDWNEHSQGNAIMFKPEVGPGKLRRHMSAQNWLSETTFKFNNAELAAFKSFYETTLEDGTKSFIWPHPVTKVSYTWSFVPKETPQVERMTPKTSKVQFRLVRL